MSIIYDLKHRRNLGRSGLTVGPAGLGAGNLGNFFRRMTNLEAEQLVDHAWNAGIRYFDTSPAYGRGRSERRLGAALADRARDTFVLSSKVGRMLAPARGNLRADKVFMDPPPLNLRYDYSYDGVMRGYEDSLQRLGVDRIDLVFIHDIGVAMHGDEHHAQLDALRSGGLRALEEFRGAGDIMGYGLGVNEIAACMEAFEYADPDLFLLAGRYTLLEQRDARPLLAACTARGVSLVIGGVFNSGILATGATAGARYNYQPAPDDVVTSVRRIEAVCECHDIPLAAAALQFPLRHPAVATVLLGISTPANLDRNLAALAVPISEHFWKEMVEERLLDTPVEI